jgi:polysaccharide biosynthesis protein PslH
MSDLLVTVHTPALGTGRGLRVYGVTRALAALGRVDVVYTVFGASEPGPEYARENIYLHPVRASRGVRRAIAYARARRRGVPRGFARGISPDLVDAVSRLASEDTRLIADGPTAAAALLDFASHRAVIYNAHNIESDLRAAQPEHAAEHGSPAAVENFERLLLERFHETWVVSTADEIRARQLVPDARVRYVPNVVDVAAMPVVPPRRSARLLFAADFSYGPNRDALGFLLDGVMPAVWSRVPAARLVLTGKSLDLPAGIDDRVDALGFVDDLGAVYAGVDCVVVPLRLGGGSPLKFVEALAYGLPVVATKLAAKGLELVPGTDFLEADDAGAFADAVANVSTHDCPDLRKHARAVAEARYSIEALTSLLA